MTQDLQTSENLSLSAIVPTQDPAPDAATSTSAPDVPPFPNIPPLESIPADELSQIQAPTPLNIKPESDGGFKAWLLVFGLSLALFCSLGYIAAWGVFQSYYEDSSKSPLLNSSSDDISWIGSTQSCMSNLLPLLSGPLSDRGHFRLTLIIGSIGIVLSAFVVAECRLYWHFLVCQGVLTGTFIGIVAGTVPVIIPQWFTKRRGLAFGVVYTGSPIGGILIPIACRNLFPRIGFAWTMRVFGFIFIVLFGLCFLVANPRNSSFASRSNFLTSPEVKRRLFTVKGLKKPSYIAYTVSMFAIILGLFTCTSTVASSIFGALLVVVISTDDTERFSCATYPVPSYVGTSAKSIGLSESTAFYMVSVANGGSGMGRILGGFAADKFGTLNMQFFALILSSTMTFIWPFVRTEAALVVITLFFGIGYGTYIALEANPVVGMADPGDLGRLLGVMWALAGISSLLSLPIPTEVKKQYGLEGMGWYAGSMILCGAFLLLVARGFVLRRIIGKA
ncbi:hypothetical protein VKT23_012534 [Stygiomarasmius scandens]|uniref:Major facilitator superfamily (MFS) profile domain-containing protein n=1 Tax=Marasmiellus scandens TaxID=2682957 RepID=A0ABR1J654_9AGAR